MCWFCDKIYNSRIDVINAISEDDSMREGIYKDNNSYSVYVGDSFEEQYGILFDIEYCPYCRKELVEQRKQEKSMEFQQSDPKILKENASISKVEDIGVERITGLNFTREGVYRVVVSNGTISITKEQEG